MYPPLLCCVSQYVFRMCPSSIAAVPLLVYLISHPAEGVLVSTKDSSLLFMPEVLAGDLLTTLCLGLDISTIGLPQSSPEHCHHIAPKCCTLPQNYQTAISATIMCLLFFRHGTNPQLWSVFS
ncbi:hypothetical protein SCLCIDRAFT_389587 [Scleroderma citrinum Foug A]|uniref:Uncharacterized protein n=1 Tax=Scleroderma citrinum Foug A TaxID=1036808 RepID=A0A0C3DCV6_9AGAM|nr:hypothetical protein SCLCIDRAFT_389587 [Scleroderma citrinum Foug A]